MGSSFSKNGENQLQIFADLHPTIGIFMVYIYTSA